MSHPDAAWSQWYCAPEGLDEELCWHVPQRERNGPTSRKRSWMISVDSCSRCALNFTRSNPMKRLTLSLAALAVIAGTIPVMAADLPAKPPLKSALTPVAPSPFQLFIHG